MTAMSTMIAAIGTDGIRAVVWGLGKTEDEALRDARENAETWDGQGKATVEITPAIVALIEQGHVVCSDLGIGITWSWGRIIHAELVTPRSTGALP